MAGELIVEKARSGRMIARIGTHYLDSRYDPEEDARRRAAAPALAGKQTVILLGDGFYYFAGLLARQGRSVHVLEPDPAVAKAALTARGAGELSGFSLAFAGELADLDSLARYLPPGISPLSVAVVEHSQSAALFPETVGQLRRLVKEWLARRVAELETTAWFGRRWLANILDNLAILPGRPAVVPGGSSIAVIAVPGPSLEACLPQIKRYRDRIRLIALAPAVRCLLNADLVPDLVCTMDGGWANALHLTGIRLPATPLCFALYSHAALVAAWRGPLVPVSLGSPIEARLGCHDFLPVFRETPTVAGFALQAARLGGARQIILAGQDFAAHGFRQHCGEYRFDQDGETKDTRVRSAQRRLDAPYRGGWEKRGHFRSNRKLGWYAADFASWAGPGVFVMTATPFLPALAQVDPAIFGTVRPTPALCRYTGVDYPRGLSGAEALLAQLGAVIARCGSGMVDQVALFRELADDSGISAILELLRPAALAQAAGGAVKRAAPAFFSGLSLELERVAGRLEKLVKSAERVDDI